MWSKAFNLMKQSDTMRTLSRDPPNNKSSTTPDIRVNFPSTKALHEVFKMEGNITTNSLLLYMKDIKRFYFNSISL